MLPAPEEVILIGIGGACIVHVSEEVVEYIDMTGQKSAIELKECASNWVRYHDQQRHDFIPVGRATQEEIDAENTRCVGMRGHGWVQFMNKRKTRFEFGTWEDGWRQLVGPLLVAGWRTFDAE